MTHPTHPLMGSLRKTSGLALALELGIPLAQDCQTLRDKLEEEPNVSNS